MPNPPERRKADVNAHLRIDGVVTRLDAVEEWMEGFKLQMTDVGNEVKANTKLTEEIHGNTMDIVEAVRWMKTSRKYAIHGCGLIVAFVGVAKVFGFL